MTVRNPLTLSFPCTLLVYQYHKNKRLEDSFYKIIRLASSKEATAPVTDLPDDYKYKLHIPISPKDIYRYGAHFSAESIVAINELLELNIRDLIRAAFIDEIQSAARNKFKFRITPLINDVLERFGLSEEAKSFETARKDLQRYCKANNISYKEEKNFSNPVPKMRRRSAMSAKDGIPLNSYLKSMGISRRTFFYKHRHQVKTFTYKRFLYVHLDSIPADMVSFGS